MYHVDERRAQYLALLLGADVHAGKRFGPEKEQAIQDPDGTVE